MKTFFFVFASILFALTVATHVPGHATTPKHAKFPKVADAENRVLTSGPNEKDELNGIGLGYGGIGGLGGLGGIGGLGGLGGIGGLGGMGGIGGIGGIGGAGGYRALRGLSDEQANDGAAKNDNDVVVVAGGAVVRGGAVVARPRPRPRGPWY
ncbi:hypothetical protein PI124_g936 [Phytophthora idaei]|nr:hypothetical protein PI125_g9076 [Phytophthora idaei]KAG3155574.1 hypothetical protein PI126_g9117 [Phytophthora idaei]KAG3254457.1 hypothetical protein PI124_g936 [Phytophthora idaei]